MRNQARNALLALCLALFACLLLSGAQRLIASGEDRPSCATVTVQAYLCGAPADAAQADRQNDARARWEGRAAEAVQALADCAPGGACSDANGNVLTSAVSYLRTVYQAFVLGDGFA